MADLLTQSSLEVAHSILDRVPLIDGHNDWPHLIRGYYDNRLDARFDRDRDLDGHVDIKRLRSGQYGGLFMSAYVDCPIHEESFRDEDYILSMRDTLQQIDLIYRLVNLYADDLYIARSSSDVTNVFSASKIAIIISIEGLHQIGNSKSVLRNYHRLGVRCATLAHSQHNMYADSERGKPMHNGLSQEGELILREMNRIMIMIDLSHALHEVMHQVLDLSVAPVVFTHSSCFALVASSRNVPDDVLDKLKLNCGIVMIRLIPQLTHKDTSRAHINHVVDHIIHVGDRIGFNHVGIGSDYDGMEKGVIEAEEAGKLPQLVACMISRSISIENVEKIIGNNVLRVMSEVEAVAERLLTEQAQEYNIQQLWNKDFRDWVRNEYPSAEQDTDTVRSTSLERHNQLPSISASEYKC
ncbi:hypothetical protein BU23DRAFT_647857 [Bimuria novae-zelandiae CBS 107.79]|uniref:Dipeptidase n=1 Tax=Bimuria novae-zelandiae CBS 107.79 TaxID=1447943 RepID=A0A6A5VMX2_9PLEO|nr:hypothetical protein BU23DRAFT_647857 [Bimuria novae-zelandiae CBS 107.79]